jgi:nucleoid-associated protein YgaU
MNNIIPVSRLGELLAAKTGADVEACTKFVKEYFGLIEATLAAGEDVTIKGIGTFKLTGDDAEPVIYQVDADLASTVNAPFEAFSAFELTDDELTDAPEPSEKPSEEPSEEASEEAIAEPTEPVEPTEPEIEPEPEVSEPEPVVEPELVAEPEPKPAPVVEAVHNEILEPVEEPESEETSDSYEPIEQTENSLPRGLRVFWFVIVFVLGLLLGLAGGYFGHNYINSAITGVPQTEVTAPNDTIAENTDTLTLADASVTAEALPVETLAEKPKEPRYDTITGSCYLTTLARKYYGNMEFWVYIYDANELGNPNRITPGTKVRIPYPEELQLTGDSATDTKAAKQRASAIYAKYK